MVQITKVFLSKFVIAGIDNVENTKNTTSINFFGQNMIKKIQYIFAKFPF